MEILWYIIANIICYVTVAYLGNNFDLTTFTAESRIFVVMCFACANGIVVGYYKAKKEQIKEQEK